MKTSSRALLLAGTLATFSCGKSKKSDTATAANPEPAKPGAGGSSSETAVSMTGKLALTASLADGSLGLADESRKLAFFTLIGGNVFGAPSAIDVKEDGSFSVDLAKNNDKLIAAQTAISQSPIDRGPLKAAFSAYASYIDAATDAQLKSDLQSMLDSMAAMGGPQAVIASYVPSGDALAEAKTFQFVGMKTAGANLMVFPADQMIYNIDLGSIVGSGDDATSEVTASGDMFKFGDDGVTQLAEIGQTLKAVKNYWVNKTADGSDVNIEAQPFFMWQGKFSNMGSSGALPNTLTYTGYGMYVRVSSNTLTFDKTCPSGGTPEQSLQLYPPAEVPWMTINNDGTRVLNKTLSSSSPFDNSQPSRMSQNGKSTCNGSGTGFYLRDDGEGKFMANWGTGGSLQGKVPAGFWNLKLDGSSLGQFDLSAGYPLDADGHAKVPIPVMAFVKSGSNLTEINASMKVYNSATKAYEDLGDLATFKKMASSIGFSVSVLNGNGSDEHRGVVGGGEGGEGDVTVTWSEDGTLKAALSESLQKALADSYADTGKIFGVRMSYIIGGSTYNFSLQAGN